MEELAEKRNVESWLKAQGIQVNHNYMFVERSIRPTFQLRGDNSSPWALLMRKPYLFVITSDEIILQTQGDYLAEKESWLRFSSKEVKEIDIEKLTPFHEYCLSFKADKRYYFYLNSETSFLEKQFSEKSISLINFEWLLEQSFYGWLK